MLMPIKILTLILCCGCFTPTVPEVGIGPYGYLSTNFKQNIKAVLHLIMKITDLKYLYTIPITIHSYSYEYKLPFY